MTEEKSERIEELVSSTGEARSFTFKSKNEQLWQVCLGDLGLVICEHTRDGRHKLLVKEPNFTLMFKEFPSLMQHLKDEGLGLTEPVLCWLRGLIHAFMVENPNPVNCSVVMTGTSSTRR